MFDNSFLNEAKRLVDENKALKEENALLRQQLSGKMIIASIVHLLAYLLQNKLKNLQV